MINGASDLVTRGLSSPLGEVLRQGDWYLVGSRTLGFADHLSDWDTVLICARDDVEPPAPADVDAAYDITRPRLDGHPTLAFHVEWRSAGAVDIEILGPQARRAQQRTAFVPWAHAMRAAQPLHTDLGIGQAYRTEVESEFAATRGELARGAYAEYRLRRNEAVSALARPDTVVQVALSGACAMAAARFWLLAAGEPHPADKWLIPALDRAAGGGAELAGLIRRTVDAQVSASDRFDAHWAVWRAVDRRAGEAGIATD